MFAISSVKNTSSICGASKPRPRADGSCYAHSVAAVRSSLPNNANPAAHVIVMRQTSIDYQHPAQLFLDVSGVLARAVTGFEADGFIPLDKNIPF